MVKALFDTNILIDHLNNVSAARTEIDRYRDRAISAVTWMEVMVGANARTEAGTRAFLSNFEIIPVDDTIAEQAVMLRRSSRIKLPDAIVWSTAQVHSLLLVTRNTKDFPSGDPGIRIPYTL